MLSLMIAFLVMLNPFALFVYLNPIMKELSQRDFLKVLLKASLISYGIYILFLILGDFIFQKIFQINFESFRIFGGIVIFSFAYFYIVKGQKALINIKEDLDDLASEIALPFMVGAGTISITILMSHTLILLEGVLAIFAVMFLNFVLIMFLKSVKDGLERRKHKIAFDKYMRILLRLSGFFIGAIGINMIVTGILNLFFG